MIRRVTLLGHKDHGKSTLIGNLAIITGSVTEARINDAKKTSKKLGLQFEPGFILDSFYEEREGGLTIDTTRAQIKYKDSAFEFIDVPGHEELTKNMISGASYADVALLMVSTKKDEGIKPQTKRHIFIAKMLGITKLVVAINKMDAAKYSEEIFEEIKHDLSEYLSKIGFDRNNVAFVPISAYTGEGLIKNSKNMSWYKGATLIELLKKMSEKKEISRIELAVLLQGEIGRDKKIVAGKVVSGVLNNHSQIMLLPGKELFTINDIVVRGGSTNNAVYGENVAIVLDKEPKNEVRGKVLVEKDMKKKAVREIVAMIFFIRKISGHVSLLINGSKIDCMNIEIIKTIDIVTGKESELKIIKPLGAIQARIRLNKEVFVEDFQEMPELGRFVIYDNDKFSGIGVVEVKK